MPNVSGSFYGKATSITIASLDDTPNHEMRLVTVSGIQKTSDPKWNNCPITYCDVSDFTGGSGPQHGYFSNMHANGDRDFGTFEGRVKTAGGQTTLEGTWKYTNGTGEFAGITGGGTYKGRMTSPSELENNWEGKYELAAKARAA
jgi:hypothetical protein